MAKPLGTTMPGSKRITSSDIMEIILGFALLGSLNFVWFASDLGYTETSPHPYWLVIIPISMRYGFRAGMISGLIGACMFFALTVGRIPDLSFQDYFNFAYWRMPLSFLVGGLVVGEIRQLQLSRYLQLKKDYDTLLTDFTALNKQFHTLSQAKQEVDTRILSQEQTLVTLHEAAEALRTLNIEEIYPAVLEMAEKFLMVSESSIYLIQSGRFELAAFRSRGEVDHPQFYALNEGIMGRAFTKSTTISLNTALHEEQLLDSRFLISAPIISPTRDKVIGILNIEKMPFLKFTPQSVRMVSLIAEWCGSSIENAQTHQEVKDKLIADEITGAYKKEYFYQRMEEEVPRARRFKLPLTILYMEIPRFTDIPKGTQGDVLKVLSLVFKSKLRQIDLIFLHDKPGTFLLLLPSTHNEGAYIVIKKIMDEVHAFQFKPFEDEETILTIVAGAYTYTNGNETIKDIEKLAEEDANGRR